MPSTLAPDPVVRGLHAIIASGARLVAPIIVAALAACRDAPTVPHDQLVRVDAAWVTGDAAAAVDPTSGLFRLAEPGPRYVTREAAETLAVAVAHFLGDPLLVGGGPGALQQERGAPIEFDRLAPCGRATYSVSPVGELPPAAPGWTRRAYSSRWAIPLCGPDGSAQLSVGVPDGPRDIRVVDGRLEFRQFGGGTDFDMIGVPVRFPSGLPLTPEAAVQAVFERTRIPTRAVPVAFNQFEGSVGQLPLCASWRVRLDQPVSVRNQATGAVDSVSELFVRHVPACFSDSTAFYVPSATQPASLVVRFAMDTTGHGSRTDRDSVEAPLIGPTRFDLVVP